MKTYPILDIEYIKDVAEYLGRNNKRDEVLTILLASTGLRIEDALKLRVRDVRGESGKIRGKTVVKVSKTGENIEVDITDSCMKVLSEYVKGKPGYEYIFLSKQRSRVDKDTGAEVNGQYPITRQRAWMILKEAGNVFGIRLSPHALRKTFARRLYEVNGKDIMEVMDALGHSNPKQTKTYIGISGERKRDNVNKVI